MYFGEEDEDQLMQEDKALSYLVLASEQDDAFDPVDTENLLAQLSAGNNNNNEGFFRANVLRVHSLVITSFSLLVCRPV